MGPHALALVLGWFALPLFVLTRLRLSVVTLAGMLVLSTVIAGLDKPLPLMGNILYERGLGPLMVAGIEGSGPRWAWWALTVASIIGAAYVAEVTLQTLRALWRERHETRECVIPALRVGSLVGLWGLVLAHAMVNVFDRYLVAALPSFVVLIVLELRTRPHQPSRVRWTPAVALLVFMAAFAVLATRDHMQWQRARWDVINVMIEQGMAASDLDGGYKFNGQVRGIGFSPGPADHAPCGARHGHSARRPLLRHLPPLDWSSRRGDLREAGTGDAESPHPNPAVITRVLGTDNAIRPIRAACR